MRTLVSGAMAGAAGTATLDLVSYVDMYVSGRPASTVPERTVARALARVGLTLRRDPARRSAAGALGGLAAGVGIGVAAATVRRLGIRLPWLAESAGIGLAAMAATDTPAAFLGVSDPRSWTTRDWMSDVVPHLAYGVAVRQTLDLAERARTDDTDVQLVRSEPPRGATLRAGVLGAAAGMRSSLGFAAPLVSAQGRGAGPKAALGVFFAVGEMVMDKLPSTPSRLEPVGVASRVVSGAVGGGVLARRAHENAPIRSLVGIAGALAGTFGGSAWRAWAAGRGVPDWQAAVVEDVVAVGLAAAAVS
ncbi:hypothetical protein [Rhodococcus sp. HNM0569]|uniref:hypothetical protein n=1 Tax=Rhodococcus sp. HNM0569 TaxID=2716340 RepID=UPI00146C55A8|nr:hypothetical protein [Rhodococcus sp. HNM0569]NLU84578.1 hypothetical protein [Rhodococcus sp. HNM0569]